MHVFKVWSLNIVNAENYKKIITVKDTLLLIFTSLRARWASWRLPAAAREVLSHPSSSLPCGGCLSVLNRFKVLTFRVTFTLTLGNTQKSHGAGAGQQGGQGRTAIFLSSGTCSSVHCGFIFLGKDPGERRLQELLQKAAGTRGWVCSDQGFEQDGRQCALCCGNY